MGNLCKSGSSSDEGRKKSILKKSDSLGGRVHASSSRDPERENLLMSDIESEGGTPIPERRTMENSPLSAALAAFTKKFPPSSKLHQDQLKSLTGPKLKTGGSIGDRSWGCVPRTIPAPKVSNHKNQFNNNIETTAGVAATAISTLTSTSSSFPAPAPFVPHLNSSVPNAVNLPPSSTTVKDRLPHVVSNNNPSNCNNSSRSGHRPLPLQSSSSLTPTSSTFTSDELLETSGNSKEIQTSNTNVSKDPVLGGPRGKFERGHCKSKQEAEPKMVPHCSNPLCRHNTPSTAISSSLKKLICLCGRTMSMVKLAEENLGLDRTETSAESPGKKNLLGSAKRVSSSYSS